jgi:hypothetical protein
MYIFQDAALSPGTAANIQRWEKVMCLKIEGDFFLDALYHWLNEPIVYATRNINLHGYFIF